MSVKQLTTKIIIEVDNRNGRHKVTRHGVNRDTEGNFPDAPFQEPAKRADIQTILGEEVGLNAEKVAAQSTQIDQLEAAGREQLETIAELTSQVETKQTQLDELQKSLEVESHDNTIDATTLRLALLKVGFGPEEIEAELQKLDKADPAKAKEVRIIWEYNTHYDRANPLVDMMAERAGLSSEQVDGLFGIQRQ